MLKLENVDVDFSGYAALSGVSFSVEPREFVVVLGASGCGKTTLLRLIAGSLSCREGCVKNKFRRLAVVYQEPRLLPWADALDNAAFGLKALGVGVRERRAIAKLLLARFGFQDADMRKRPAALSGGMRQRVAIARALAIEPDLILLDEPFSALDSGLRRRLQDETRAAVERLGAALLFVTHDAPEAARLASRILVLSKNPGRLVADIFNAPEPDPALAFQRAANLLQRPEVAAALF